MRYVNKNILSGLDAVNTNGSQIDANQLVAGSFQVYFGDANAAGIFKIQASNDPCDTAGYLAGVDFTATNWVDVPSQSAVVSGGMTAILTIPVMCYRWVRAVYTNTGTGTQHIFTVADVASSLNSKYFFINKANGGTAYVVWFNVNGAGVAPVIAGKTAVEVDIAIGDSAPVVAAALEAALAAIATTPFVTSVSMNDVTVTNSAAGPFTSAVDFNTGFTFTITAGGSTTVNVLMNALSM